MNASAHSSGCISRMSGINRSHSFLNGASKKSSISSTQAWASTSCSCSYVTGQPAKINFAFMFSKLFNIFTQSVGQSVCYLPS